MRETWITEGNLEMTHFKVGSKFWVDIPEEETLQQGLWEKDEWGPRGRPCYDRNTSGNKNTTCVK